MVNIWIWHSDSIVGLYAIVPGLYEAGELRGPVNQRVLRFLRNRRTSVIVRTIKPDDPPPR